MCTEGEFAGYLEVWVEKKIDLRFFDKMVTKTSVDLEKNDVEQHIFCKVNCHHCYI